MAKEQAAKSVGERKLGVGDRVSFRLAGRKVMGTIVEDRGKIGAGRRRLVAVRAKLGPEQTSIIEVPAEEVERPAQRRHAKVLPSLGTSGAARTRRALDAAVSEN
jgi:hypothetical protein